MRRVIVIAFAASASAFALDPQLIERAKQEEQRSCTQCHGLRLVHSQRLAVAAWEKELNKMVGWGAEISEPQLLLEYLSQEYSAAKPMPPAEFTGDGAKNRIQR